MDIQISTMKQRGWDSRISKGHLRPFRWDFGVLVNKYGICKYHGIRMMPFYLLNWKVWSSLLYLYSVLRLSSPAKLPTSKGILFLLMVYLLTVCFFTGIYRIFVRRILELSNLGRFSNPPLVGHPEIPQKGKWVGIPEISKTIWDLLGCWNFRILVNKYGICNCHGISHHIMS